MNQRDQKAHELDEQYDQNRAKRERAEECTMDTNCGVHVSVGQCRLQHSRRKIAGKKNNTGEVNEKKIE